MYKIFTRSIAVAPPCPVSGAVWTKYRYLFLLWGAFLAPYFADAQGITAQQTQISGKITEANGTAVPGVTVREKDGKAAAASDINGVYKISVSDKNATLVFSMLGFNTQEIRLAGRSTLDVQLTTGTSALEEVVVVAYGTQKKRDITGAMSSIKSANLENIPVISVEELLKGQAAGVQASVSSGTPGAASNITIRGVSSITASTQPLYVVDGLPIPGQSIETGFAESRTGMDFINPADIESIEILKDASATAIYGARGANGVILITTKGGKAGVNRTTFTAATGLTTIANKIKFMTTQENQEYWALALARAGRTEPGITGASLYTNTDWQGVTGQTAVRQNYNASFQGGQQKLQYYLSLDYLDQNGLLKYTKYNKYSIRGNLTAQVNDKFRVDNRFTITQTRNDGSFTGGQGGNPNATGATQRILQAPTFRVPNDLRGGVDEETGEIYVDPLVVLRDLSDDIKVTNLTEQLTLKYSLLPGLDFQAMGSLTYRFFNNDQYQGPDYASTKNDSRITAQVDNNYTRNYLNENTLTYTKKFSDHNLTLLLGNTIQEEASNGTSITGIGFPNTTTGVNALQNATESTISSFKQRWQLSSFFGRVNYDYKSRYLLTATVRRDGSSKLAPGNKWATFPSAAFGWRISEEPFFKPVKAISNLKLRLSWGQIGNSEIGVYQTLSTLSAGTGAFNNALMPYYTLGRYGDPNLKWEISEQANIGLDMELVNGRLSVTADVFDKRTRDLLLANPTPFSSGYGSYLTNIGSMSNKGLELTIGYQAVQRKNFSWNANFNFTLLNNKVTDLGVSDIVAVGQTVDGKSPRYLTVGRSVGTFYLVKTAGVWQLGEEQAAAVYNAKPGDWKFVDQNGDKQITNDDRVFLGDALPKYSLGLTNTFKYKNFDLLVLVTGDFGAKTLNAVKPNLWLARKNGGAAYNLRAWSPANPTNELAAPSVFYNSDFLHDGYLESADIIRLTNVKLGYRLNLNKKAKSSVYLYLSGNNVFSWSAYEGYDPEVGNGINRGIDRFAYPRGRVYSFGAQVSF